MVQTSSYFSLTQAKVIVEKITSTDWHFMGVDSSIFGGLTLEWVVQDGIRKSAKETMNSKLVCNTSQPILF